MRRILRALACAGVVLSFGCGNGGNPGQVSPPDMAKKIFAARSASLTSSQREGIYDHCSYDVAKFCPQISPSAKNYFRRAAACLHDHAQDITDDCSNAFQTICGDSGDDCDFDHAVAGPGYKNADGCTARQNYYDHHCYAACAEGLVFYQGKCLNLKTDPNNCGDIGNQCDVPGGDPCFDGECIAACPTDSALATDCGGTCTDTNSDYYNCGACGHSCGVSTTDESTRSCKRGECVTSCGGTVCTPPPHSTPTCGVPVLYGPVAQTCGFTCDQGYQKSDDGKSCVKKETCAATTEVLVNGHCYYLDGSGGACDPGYSKGPESVLSHGLFSGKTYKHTVSDDCCVRTTSALENYGMGSTCNAPGPFGPNDPEAGAQRCTGANVSYPHQLTLCGK